MDEKFAKWNEIDRETINWNPKVDENKCVGCGMCVTTCGRNVYDFDKEKNKAIVARPLNCMVGCTSCEVWCVFNAITFPDKQYVKDLIKREGLVNSARKELEKTVSSKK